MPEWIHNRAEHLLSKNPNMNKSMAFAVATQQSHALGKSPKGYGTAEGRSKAKAKFDTPEDDEKRAGVIPDARLVVEGTHEGVAAAGRILAKIQQLGSGGHSFSIVSPDDVNEEGGGNLGGWDGDGNTHLVSARVETLDGKQSKSIMEGGKEKVGGVVLALLKTAGLLSMARGIPGAAKGVALGTNELNMHRNEVAGLGVLAVPGLDTMQSRLRARLAGDKTEHGAEKRRLLGEGAHAALDVGGLGLLAAPAVAHLKHAFANSAYAGQPAQNGPGMRGRSQIPPFVAPALDRKLAGVGVGSSMTASQYSGPLSFGRFKMESQIPAFTSPGMSKEESGGAKTAGSMNTATDAMSPAGKLNVTQRVGAPRTQGISGPSIADIAKPKGFGTPISGAKKNML